MIRNRVLGLGPQFRLSELVGTWEGPGQARLAFFEEGYVHGDLPLHLMAGRPALPSSFDPQEKLYHGFGRWFLEEPTKLVFAIRHDRRHEISGVWAFDPRYLKSGRIEFPAIDGKGRLSARAVFVKQHRTRWRREPAR